MTLSCIQCLISSDFSLNTTQNLLDMTLAKEDMYLEFMSTKTTESKRLTKDT